MAASAEESIGCLCFIEFFMLVLFLCATIRIILHLKNGKNYPDVKDIKRDA